MNRKKYLKRFVVSLLMTMLLLAFSTPFTAMAQESAQISAGSEVTAPQISLKNVFSGIKISWNKVSGAEGYNVYRKGQYDTEWICVDNTKSSEYLDTFPTRRYGQTFAYKVCIASSDGKSIKGTFSPVKTLVSLRKPTISGFKVANAKAGIKLNVYTYSTNGNGFIVYRKGPDESAYIRIAKVKRTGNNTVYIDTDAAEGESYSYKVCYYKSSSKGAVSRERTCVRMGAVSLTIKQTEKKVKLSWNEYPNASGYQIYSGINGNSYHLYKETTDTEFTESIENAYQYDEIEPDWVGKRCYKVRPYYNDGANIWYGVFSSGKTVS